MGVESYAHKAAKAVVLGWLRDAAAEAGWDNTASCAGFSWRVNRRGPSFGVWAECPILEDFTGIAPTWDEAWWDEAGSLEQFNHPWSFAPPSFDELVSRGTRPRAILDIAIQHKGCTICGIEIVHKHPIPPEKLAFLRHCGLMRVIELPARWVLGQIGVPAQFPVEFYRIAPSYVLKAR